MVNEYYTHITDGLCIEIERFPKGDFHADCYYVEPVRGRKQHRETLRAKSYEEAKAFAEKWLGETLEAHREVIERHHEQLYESLPEGQLSLF